MINPSAHGWVAKFFFEQGAQEQFRYHDFKSFYVATRKTGFLVGYATHFVVSNAIDTKGWTTEEFSKVALLNSLFGVYQISKQTSDNTLFLNECVTFYKQLHPKNSGLIDLFLPTDSNENKLEKIISNRIKTNENIISKNFSHILTNALLFLDVLAFKKFLSEGELTPKYLKKFEEVLVSLVTMALNAKATKSRYDELLLKLFESSVRYSKFSKMLKESSLDEIKLSSFKDEYEKYYLLDLCGMAMWSDEKMEVSEKQFLLNLSEILGIPEDFTIQSMEDMNQFLMLNRDKIPYFNYSNPVKHFYDQTTSNVQTLVKRNKKRLLLEISQSKELVQLLRKSTTAELSSEEKKKVKSQLLDICKTVPSLTIFLVPGGSLLLPILIKFIPQMLPSAFNENLDKN